jgi:hypothetical protein
MVVPRGAAPALVVALALALVGLAGAAAPAHAAEQRAWVKRIPDAATWERYSQVVGADRFGKFIIDVKTDEIYFIDTGLFRLHADFVLGVLLKQAWTAENVREYNKNYERVKPRFVLGYVTHHGKLDRWTLSFWEGDQIDAAGILATRKRLAPVFFVKNLRFRPDSPAQEKVAREVAKRGMPVITNDELYKLASYQAFHDGRAVGTLRVVPPGTPYESLLFDRHDIVLLQESYPDITPVAGILSTTFSTPLSHVNLRATAWDVPNAGHKEARTRWGHLDGKVVYYEVGAARMALREASADEIATYRDRIDRVRKVDLPAADVSDPRLPMLSRLAASDVTRVGTKTANLGAIVTGRTDVAVPAGFGLPFYYYVRHLQQHGLDHRVTALLGDPRFASDPVWRKAALEGLRKAIVDAPIDPAVLTMVYKRVRVKLGGAGVFVRSSTNAEDLPGFNGAGLYDTVPNVRGKEALGAAIKTVWASLWNLRAVEERTAFGIDHRQVYAAVLIQIGVAATAVGVLVSTNLYDPTDGDGFIINAKWGFGMRVVEGQKVPEQIVFDATNDGTKIISRADESTMLVFDQQGGIQEVAAPAGTVILTEPRAKRLVTAVQRIIPLFPRGAPLDVEWVLEGETIWIVQARPFIR